MKHVETRNRPCKRLPWRPEYAGMGEENGELIWIRGFEIACIKFFVKELLADIRDGIDATPVFCNQLRFFECSTAPANVIWCIIQSRSGIIDDFVYCSGLQVSVFTQDFQDTFVEGVHPVRRLPHHTKCNFRLYNATEQWFMCMLKPHYRSLKQHLCSLPLHRYGNDCRSSPFRGRDEEKRPVMERFAVAQPMKPDDRTWVLHLGNESCTGRPVTPLQGGAYADL